MGAIVRRGTKHKARFYAQYRDVNGVRRTKLLRGATSTEQARALLATIEHNITSGRAGLKELTEEEKTRASITVAKLSERFLAEYAPPRIKNLANYRLEARSVHKVRILPVLGTRAAASITTEDVERLRDRQGAELSAASVVQTLAHLSRLYTWAKKAKLIDCDNPVKGCERPRAASSLDYLSKAEVAQLLEHAQEHAPDVYPMIATAVYQGLRKGELYGLRWSDIAFDAGRLDVNRSYRTLPKSGEARHLPLHVELDPVLRAWQKRCPAMDEGLVFPLVGARGPRLGNEGDNRGLSELLTAARCHLPADGRVWHMLRHTFASHFMMAGGSILTLQKLLGHSDLKMTMRYAHLSPDHLASEIARMSFAQAPAGTTSLDAERARRAAKQPA